jgi:hypothetical protein
MRKKILLLENIETNKSDGELLAKALKKNCKFTIFYYQRNFFKAYKSNSMMILLEFAIKKETLLFLFFNINVH